MSGNRPLPAIATRRSGPVAPRTTLVERVRSQTFPGRWRRRCRLSGVPEWAPSRGYTPPDGSPGSILAASRVDMDAGRTMRLHPRSVLLAAALIAPAAAFTAACGDSDHSAAAPQAKAAATTNAAVAPSAVPTLASQLQGVVAAGSPGVIALVNDGHGVKLQAAGVAD